MMKNYKNKQIVNAENKEISEEYFFPGGLEYQPITIKAKSREEAEEIWVKERKKINK